MTHLLEQERALYEHVWSSVESYGDLAPGERSLPIFLDLVGTARGTVLDAGCGSGKGALALRQAGFTVALCDLTDAGLSPEASRLPFVEACLWHDLRDVPRTFRGMWGRATVDYTYCCDVLEHVPPQFTMLVIDQLLRITKTGLFLSITLLADNLGIWVGQSLHQTVEPFVWWRDSLREVGELVDARDLHATATFYLRPRR